MTTININEIDWVIIKNDYHVSVRASIGDLSLGQRIYKFETKENAKQLAIKHIKQYGSLNQNETAFGQSTGKCQC